MKIIGVGQNYIKHIQELGGTVPEEPVIFLKPDTSLLKNNSPFYLPSFSKEIHHEIELVVRIKKEGKSISREFAENYYDQFALGIDFTARDLQNKLKKEGKPWALAKGFNDSAPVSEFISSDSLDAYDIGLRLEINGKIKQDGNTSDMLFKIPELIEYISSFMTLKTGDLIFTGTPSGVGPVKIGDHVTGYLNEEKLLDFEIK